MQPSSSSSSCTSRTASECSATAAAELAGKMADISVVDSCHGNVSVLTAHTSLADVQTNTDTSLADVITVDEISNDESCTELRQQSDESSDTEAGVDEYCQQGVYCTVLLIIIIIFFPLVHL